MANRLRQRFWGANARRSAPWETMEREGWAIGAGEPRALLWRAFLEAFRARGKRAAAFLPKFSPAS